MCPQKNWIAAFAWLFLAVTVTTAQREQDSHGNVVVKMEVLDLNNGLPGAGTNSVAAVGARFGKETTTEKDKSGKLLYLRTIDGQSRWLPDNAIEVKLDIKENGAKRTETIRLENFEPKTVLLRENRAVGWRELLRLIPVFEPNELPCHVAG
jgi:hypothetical protein